jgi:hypothetical protein
MRTIETTLYTFDELSVEAKTTALNNHCNTNEFTWSDEWFSSLNKGIEAFGSSLKRGYSIDWSSANCSYAKAEEIEYWEDISGERLRTWIYNNLYSYLFVGKTYRKAKKRVSRVLFVENDCPFTGYCGDESFLKPARELLKQRKISKTYTLQDLLEDCIDSLIRAAQNDYEWELSEEYFADMCDANNYEFTEDGERI